MATSPSTDAWLARLDLVVRLARAKWTERTNDLDAVLHTAQQLAHWLPRAIAYLDPGDGLRSPSLEPSGPAARPLGDGDDPELAGRVSYSDPTAATALSAESYGWDLQRVRAGQDHAITLLRCSLSHDDPDRARANITSARQALVQALGVVESLLPAPSTVKRLKNTGDHGCRSCARVTRSDGRGRHFSDTYRGTLCRWCFTEAQANRTTWIEAHPDATPAEITHERHWPSTRLVEWKRDHGEKNLSPGERARLEAKPKRAKRGRAKRRVS